MPKPVLSDSLFNADDVATAVLAEANLQIANSDLGVVDILNKFDNATGISRDTANAAAYFFMGFVFLNFSLTTTSPTNNTNFTLLNINDSTYFPERGYLTNSVSYQGDTMNQVAINTDGTIMANSILIPGGSDAVFRININSWYRV